MHEKNSVATQASLTAWLVATTCMSVCEKMHLGIPLPENRSSLLTFAARPLCSLVLMVGLEDMSIKPKVKHTITHTHTKHLWLTQMTLWLFDRTRRKKSKVQNAVVDLLGLICQFVSRGIRLLIGKAVFI